MISRDQALHKLKDRLLSAHDRERLHQYIHFLDTEGISPQSAKRPAQNFKHTNSSSNTRHKPKP